MSSQPEQRPEDNPENDPLSTGDASTPADESSSSQPPSGEWTSEKPGRFLAPLEGDRESLPALERHETRDGYDPPLFQYWSRPATPKIERIPNAGHLGILFLIAICGLFCAGLVARLALHWHLFGVSTLSEAANEIHFTLGSEGLFYIFTFLGCLVVFPILWGKGFFAGLQWRGATALHYRGRLISAAGVCFILALVNGVLLPGPANTPIDRIFRMPGAAWMLFAFGVTLAPFFEEIAFRGFLLPALSTAFDWLAERAEGTTPHPLDENGHPQWSMPAMIIAAIITSVLFALMHGDQTGYSLGPFLLLVCVSLVLCWARLSTRSLAASVLVHACYNFFLFSLMFLGTSGFKHLDNM